MAHTKHLEVDNRGQLLHLTQQGRRILPELSEIAYRNDRRFFDCLDAKERRCSGKCCAS